MGGDPCGRPRRHLDPAIRSEEQRDLLYGEGPGDPVVLLTLSRADSQLGPGQRFREVYCPACVGGYIFTMAPASIGKAIPVT